MDNLIQHYYDLGWNIIPSPLGQKHPSIPWREFEKRKITYDEIKVHFAEQCNVLVITGSISNNLCVIDIDAYKNPKIIEAFKKLLENAGIDIDKVPRSRTARGGLHYFFYTEEAVSCSPIDVSDLVGDNEHNVLDVRGEGGLIVLPPSVFNQKQYQWELLATRENIVFLNLDQIEKLRLTAYGMEVYFDIKHLLNEECDVFDEILQNYIDVPNHIIPEGRRNTVLSKVAGLLIDRGFGKATTFYFLKGINERKCKPPLTEKEVHTISLSIWKSAMSKGIKIKSEIVEKMKKSQTKMKSEGIKFDSLVRILKEPVEYELTFSQEGATHTVRLSDKDLLSWSKVRVAIMNQANILATEMNMKDWEYILRGLLTKVRNVKPNPLEDKRHELLNLFYNFVKQKINDANVAQAKYKNLEEAVRNACRVYVKDSYVFFYLDDIVKYCKYYNDTISRGEIKNMIYNFGGVRKVPCGYKYIILMFMDMMLLESKYNDITKEIEK